MPLLCIIFAKGYIFSSMTIPTVVIGSLGDKFSATTIPTVVMGSLELQKGYVLLDTTNSKFFMSRDFTFQDEVFLLVAGPSESHSSSLILHGSPLEMILDN